MTEFRTMYDELMADLTRKGYWWDVNKLHDYKNAKSIHAPTYTDSKTKNESPADLILLNGGASSLKLLVGGNVDN